MPLPLAGAFASTSSSSTHSGVAVDADASVDRLVGPTLNPVTLIKRLSGTDVHAVTTVDSGELTNALNAAAEKAAGGEREGEQGEAEAAAQ